MREPYEPSRTEIRRQCLDIRVAWSPEEEMRRRGGVKKYWNPPQCDRSPIVQASSWNQSE